MLSMVVPIGIDTYLPSLPAIADTFAASPMAMGADAIDIGKTIHPHPTLGESIGMAAEVAHGSCTDLPPERK